MRMQFAFFGAGSKFADFGRDFGQRLVRSVRNDWRYKASGYRDSNADVGARILQHIVTGKADIALRYLNQRQRQCLDQHIVYRQLDTTRLQ